MRLFITGANGFVGSAVVQAALDRGHEVCAMVRPSTSLDDTPWAKLPGVTVVRGDLRRRGGWEAELGGCDALVHLAAAGSGDFYTQFAATVIGTENLLAAMLDAELLRLVHICSFSLYDYRAIPDGDPLDEASPLEARPTERDEYPQTKLIQEEMVRRFEREHGAAVTILRPGAIYGPGKLWNAGRALRLAGPWWVAIGPRSTQKLTYVGNCAEAIVLAAERQEAIGQTLNIVDDELPSQREYEAAMRRAGFDGLGRTVGVPVRLVRAVANGFALLSRKRFGGRLKLPAFVVPAKMESQYRPLRYPNAAAKRVLGWQPRFTLDEALRQIKHVEDAE